MHTPMPMPRHTPDADPLRSAPEEAPILEMGDVKGERYRLDREVGRTEAGVVFEAMDRALNRRVAVEIASSLEDPAARRKWARDVMLAQRLEGEHVLRVLGVGHVAGSVPYAVREAALCSMASEVEVKGALPIPLAVAWTLEACEAIAEAHSLGMAHGDLRLDNVYLVRGVPDPTVKVAWTTAAKAEGATKEDFARDVAALGAMLRVLATGRITDDEEDGAPTLPTDLAHAVARSLALDPQLKLQNVAELARMLASYAPQGHASARNIAFSLSRAGIVGGVIPHATAAPDPSSFTDEWFGGGSRASLASLLAPVVTPAAKRRERTLGFTGASLALVALVLGGSWFLRQNGQLARWTGTAEAEHVGNAEVTSGAGTAAAATPPAAAPPAPAAAFVEVVPATQARPFTTAAPTIVSTRQATATQATTAHTSATATAPAAPEPATEPPIAGTSGLRYVDPVTAPAAAAAVVAPTTSPSPDPAPADPAPADPGAGY